MLSSQAIYVRDSWCHFQTEHRAPEITYIKRLAVLQNLLLFIIPAILIYPFQLLQKPILYSRRFVNMFALISVVAVALAVVAPVSANPVLGVSVTATATATASATTVSIGPNPTEVYINSIAYGGTGCPQGSVGSFISADRSTSVLFRERLLVSTDES
jgi:hypothetical protein